MPPVVAPPPAPADRERFNPTLFRVMDPDTLAPAKVVPTPAILPAGCVCVVWPPAPPETMSVDPDQPTDAPPAPETTKLCGAYALELDCPVVLPVRNTTGLSGLTMIVEPLFEIEIPFVPTRLEVAGALIVIVAADPAPPVACDRLIGPEP